MTAFTYKSRSTRPRRPPLTANQAAEIKRLASTTNLLQDEIGARVGVNQGRVSEVLNGKRFPEVLPASY